jgi:CelD/BcsL family acetyltransferase involved in cellulose biosynthesis
MDRLRLVCAEGPMIEAFDDLAALPADAAALFDPTEFQLGADWFRTVAAHALPAGARPLFLLHRQAGRPAALLPLQRAADGRLQGLTSPYTCVFRPLLAEGADPAGAGRAFGAFCRGAGPLRLDALDPGWPGLPPLLAGLRRAGLVPLRFAHFGNWHLDLAGQDWAGYLAGRPGELRETIRRRLARAGRDASVTFDVVIDGTGLEAGIAAYEYVYTKSWKGTEPFPAFGPALLRAAAAAGVLRLGVLRQAGVPVAAQYWTVTGGTATVHKLAHDEAARKLSPGTVLTALMLRHLLEHDHVAALDFGRGDDAYKAGWTGRRRQRIGVLLCPPWNPAGAAAIASHLLGQGVATLWKALPAKIVGTRRPAE